ncbi:MAG: hypothetical protein H0W09_06420 [Solirubrobacterales bacterium]|nr:hypothetical protein [Solirubrobacterales bacterium]
MITHLQPTAPIAADAICPGDPKRAMELASALLERPLMSNLARGLWGYHGVTSSGAELTVQSTGLGGPSAAIVLGELASHGLRRAIRLGTCRSLADGPGLGEAFVVEAALGLDGTSRALGFSGRLEADPDLTVALSASLGHPTAVVASLDLPGEPEDPLGATASDLSTAAFLAACRLHQIRAAAVLLPVFDGRASLEPEAADRRTAELAAPLLVALESSQSSASATARLP